MKRILTLILALALSLALTAPASAEASAGAYVVPMYTLDGQIAYIWSYDVPAYQAVGWYLFFDAASAAVELGTVGGQHDKALSALDALAAHAPEYNDYIYQCKVYVTQAKFQNGNPAAVALMEMVDANANPAGTWIFYDATDSASMTDYALGYGDLIIQGKNSLVIASESIIFNEFFDDYFLGLNFSGNPYETCIGVLGSDYVPSYGGIFYLDPATYTRDTHITVLTASETGMEDMMANHGLPILLDRFRDCVLTPNGYTLADLGFLSYT